MTDLNPNNIAPAWEQQPWWRRCRAAVLLLSAHGFITKAESEEAYKRIDKWEAAANEAEANLQAGVRSRKDGWG